MPVLRYDVTLERDVPVPMRGGMTLSTDLYRPKGEGPFPLLLLMRLPSVGRRSLGITAPE